MTYLSASEVALANTRTVYTQLCKLCGFKINGKATIRWDALPAGTQTALVGQYEDMQAKIMVLTRKMRRNATPKA